MNHTLREYIMLPNSRIVLLLEKIKEYCTELEEVPLTFHEYDDDVKSRRFIERTLQIAIESCFDIFHQIVKDKNIGICSNDENMIQKLVTAKIISVDLGNKLKEMKKFRNVLVHRYVEIENEKVFYHATHNITDLEQFQTEVLAYLKKDKGGSVRVKK